MTLSLIHSIRGLGHFNLTVNMHKWLDDEKSPLETILDIRLSDVPEYDDTDPLIWAEQVTDAIYKAINAERARRLTAGWISGSCGTGSRASETPPLSM